MIEIEWKPEKITARDGRVLVEGPSNTAMSLEPDAADDLADHIRSAARKARQQRPSETDGQP